MSSPDDEATVHVGRRRRKDQGRWWRQLRVPLVCLLAITMGAIGAIYGPKLLNKLRHKQPAALPSSQVARQPTGAPGLSSQPGKLPVLSDQEATRPGAMVQLATTVTNALLQNNPLAKTSQAGAWPAQVEVIAGGPGSKCNLEQVKGTPLVAPCAVNGTTTLFVYEERLNVHVHNGDTTQVAAEVIYAFGNLVDKRAANTSSTTRDACFAGMAARDLHQRGFTDDAANAAIIKYMADKGGDKAAGFQRGLQAQTC
jgi:hypothetical protein